MSGEESKKAEAPKETQAAEKRSSPAKAQKGGPEEKTAAAAPTALPPELPKRALFGRRDRRFADSPEYARGFIHGIIKNYEELQRGDSVHWSSVAPGVKLASQTPSRPRSRLRRPVERCGRKER